MKVITQGQGQGRSNDRDSQRMTEGRRLLEGKWMKRYNDLEELRSKDARLAANTAIVLENQERLLMSMNEAVVSTKFGALAQSLLDVVRYGYPNSFVSDWVYTVAMNGPTDLVTYIRPIFETTHSPDSITAGDEIGKKVGKTYGSEFNTDAVGTGDGTEVDFTATLSIVPVRESTIKIFVAGVQVGQDDGEGHMVGMTGDDDLTGTIDYDAGSLVLAFKAAPANLAAITAEYYFDSESAGSSELKKISLQFTTIPVVARAWKYVVEWSVDASLKAAAALATNIEDEVTLAAIAALKSSREVSAIEDMKRAAGSVDTTIRFDYTLQTGVGIGEHSQGLRFALSKAGSTIQTAAGRGDISWAILGTNLKPWIEQVPGFVAEPSPVPIGVYKIGTLGTVGVYINPYFSDADYYLAGYLGPMPGDAGMIIADFIPLYTTPTLEHSDFIASKGLMAMYDKKIVNSSYFKLSEGYSSK